MILRYVASSDFDYGCVEVHVDFGGNVADTVWGIWACSLHEPWWARVRSYGGRIRGHRPRQ